MPSTRIARRNIFKGNYVAIKEPPLKTVNWNDRMTSGNFDEVYDRLVSILKNCIEVYGSMKSQPKTRRNIYMN